MEQNGLVSLDEMDLENQPYVNTWYPKDTPFIHYQMSFECMQLNRYSTDRDALTKLANELKQTHGMDYFAHCVVKKVKSNQQQLLIVFDSIRHPSEIDYLSSHHVTSLVYMHLKRLL